MILFMISVFLQQPCSHSEMNSLYSSFRPCGCTYYWLILLCFISDKLAPQRVFAAPIILGPVVLNSTCCNHGNRNRRQVNPGMKSKALKL